jgi:hypothetical protein
MTKTSRKPSDTPAVVAAATAKRSGALTGDKARIGVALSACAQLEHIFLGLKWQRRPDGNLETSSLDPAILDCVARRGLALTSAVMAAIDDDVSKTSDLERMVNRG